VIGQELPRGVAEPSRRGVAFRVVVLSDIDASKSFAGMAFGKTRRPGPRVLCYPGLDTPRRVHHSGRRYVVGAGRRVHSNVIPANSSRRPWPT
jgi:hypothetical protein